MLRGPAAKDRMCEFLESFLQRGDQNSLWRLDTALDVVYNMGRHQECAFYEEYLRVYTLADSLTPACEHSA